MEKMKKAKILALLSGILLVGCGPFTNAPAQLHVKTINPSSVTVNYKTDGEGVTTTAYENPTILIEGEPGSVGATFNRAMIIYRDSNGKEIPNTTLPSLDLDVSIDVGTSNYRDPADTKKILLGNGSWLAPIVTRHLIDYGLKKSNDPAAVSADITLAGKDYAWFPISLHISVPIAFVGEAQ
ncbi:MAG TPA: hypothetical protein DD435_10960 [Cyanobacteria bacterium UBA8530]|nr:hypothetical protein [Cyanobacteria bacterium UBA8530]